MHVLIEALGARVGGGVTRLLGMVEAMPRVAPQHRYSILLAPSYQQKVIDALPPGIEVVAVTMRGGNLLHRSWFQNVRLPRVAREIGADVIFAAGEGAYLRSPLPLVMVCGNLSLIAPPQVTGLPFYALLRRPFVRAAFATADRIAFVSRTMQEGAIRALGVPREKGFVAYHGVEQRFSARASEPAQPYYLAVSSINPHKGYVTLLEAWSRLPADVAPLKIAGGVLHQPTHERMLKLIAERHLEGRVELLGPVEWSSLPELYRGARTLVFPSELESFGLPLLEAMASGVPVIASDLPVSREICADAALYFAPRDAEGLAGLIGALDRDPAERRRMAEAGQAVARRFTWEETARFVVEQLDAVRAAHSIASRNSA